MTSQLVAVTQAGLAVASDTMTTWPSQNKTSPTANKIYELGSAHKVVVLHSGASFIGGLNYELLVREWALTQPSPLPALEDYPRVFLKWLSAYRKLRFDEREVVTRMLCGSFNGFLHDNDWLGEVLTNNAKILPAEAETRLCSELANWSDRHIVAERDLIPGLDEKEIRASLSRDVWVSAYEHFLDDVADRPLGIRPEWPLTDAINEALLDFAVKRLRYYCASGVSGSLAWAGFGSDEPIGGLVSMDVNGYYLDGLRVRPWERRPETGALDPDIIPLAQSDAIEEFIYGISHRRIHREMDMAARALKDTAKELSDDTVKAFVDNFREAMDRYLGNRFAGPVFGVLNGLSLPSLIEFCDALVNIQRLRSAVSNEPTTVGGVIESLSISRDGGVKWHTRLDDGSSSAHHSQHPLL